MDEWVRAYVAAGRAAWPDLVLDDDVFARHVEARAAGKELPQEHAPDLFLACACAHGAAGAVEAFERRFSGDLDAALARVAPSGAARDDAKQALRIKLFVAEGAELPRISDYAGRAPLRRWLAAAAVRIALNLRRNMADRPHDMFSSSVMRDPDARPPPELAYLRTRYKKEFEDAVRNALRALPARDATLLRLHLEQRMGVDALATMYKVGRSTAGRWLQAARAAVEAHVKERLRETLGLTASEFESIAAQLLSQLEVSVIAVLKEED